MVRFKRQIAERQLQTAFGVIKLLTSLHYLSIANEIIDFLEAAGRITQRYLEERRYLKVAFPGLADATEEQERTALSLAVPQPAFRENNPMGPAYIGCMIHEPVREAAAAMARRCESEMRDIASSLGLSLAPRAGW